MAQKKDLYLYDKIGKGLANNDCIAANKAGAFTRNDDFIARATPLLREYFYEIVAYVYLYENTLIKVSFFQKKVYAYFYEGESTL